MNLGIYFNEEEVDFIRSQRDGYVRSLVREDMEAKTPVYGTKANEVDKDQARMMAENENRSHSDHEAGRNCKECGAMLAFFGAKVCKACGKKQ
jgi:hypothetical protein